MGKVFILLLVLGTSCCLGQIGRGQSITIMSWNVQNLFDGVDDGYEYYEFSVSRGTWSEELYQKRLENLSYIIHKNSPDIVALQEIEGLKVLKDLQVILKDYPYITATEDNSSIQSGVLSRYPISAVGYLKSDRYNFNRSMLEVTIDLEGDKLIIMNNHWKSKSGDFSEHVRIESANIIKNRLKHLTEEHVIILGDLNENYNESSLVSYPTALSFNKVGEGLNITDSTNLNSDELYTPWPDSEESGSYLYGGKWETIDHILCNNELLDGEGLEFLNFYVDNREELFTKNGNVRRWITDFGTGYSDHLPIFAELQLYEVITSLE